MLNVSEAGQIETHTTESLVHDPSSFEVEIAITKLKRCASPGSDKNSRRTDSGRR
jgi:hypothetical protein